MNQFLNEIKEQPEALKNTLNVYVNAEGLNSLKAIKNLINEEIFEQIIFTGMGSSYFTSFAASNIFSNIGINSLVINASELLHYNMSLLEKKTLLICFSQSGESYEIIEILKKTPPTVKCVGITNSENSTLAKKSDLTLFSKAGKEYMTSTKTYVSIKLTAYILAWYLSDEWNKTKIELIRNFIKSFEESIESYTKSITNIIEFLGKLPSLQIIARGACYSTAMQSSLMFKEAVKIPAAGYLGGEFRHGPIEMVQEGVKTIIFVPQGKTFDQNIKMAIDIANFGGTVLLITNSDIDLSDKNIMTLQIPEKDEHLFSIQSIIPVQLFIDFYAKSKGFEAGSFSHGAKVTAVE